MNATQLNLTELIGSRICHDLISPIGAISNGVELMSMGGDMSGPEMGLISQSADNANARIRYFRIAFGAAAPQQLISSSKITTILRDNSHGARIVFDWQPKGEMSRQQVKLAFLLLQCFETAMPWGGRITVSMIGEQWAILAESEQMKIDQDLWSILSEGPVDCDLQAANVHFALAPLSAGIIGRKLSVETSENKIRVRF